jgi:ATP-binding cassette subfamily C protein
MRLFLHIASRYPSRTALMVLCLIIGIGVQAMGLSALLPLLALMVGADSSGGEQSGLQEGVVNFLASIGIELSLGNLLGFFVIAATVQSGLLLLAKRQVGFTAARMATDLRLGRSDPSAVRCRPRPGGPRARISPAARSYR